jgi:hypothetical protein
MIRKRCVTVARHGSKCATCGNGISVPIYCTAVYVGKPRVKDGKLTWRREYSLNDATSGNRRTQPMIDRAIAYATMKGYKYIPNVVTGQPVETPPQKEL